MVTIILFLALLVLLILSSLYAAAETAYIGLSPIQLKALETSRKASCRRVCKLMKDPDFLLGTILVGSNVCNIVASVLVTMITLRLADESYLAYSTVVLTMAVLVFCEVSPKQYTVYHKESVAEALSITMVVSNYVLFPVTWVVLIFGRFLNRILGIPKQTVFAKEGLFHMVTIGEEEGMVDPYEKAVVRNVFRLQDNTVMSIITHRKDVFSLASNLTIKHAIPLIMQQGFSRIPIYGSSPEDIVGIVMQQDIYKKYVQNQQQELLSSLMMKPIYVPASMKLDELVEVFSSQTLNMAIALDEYGGLAGVVSREDVVEEILGELYDENEVIEIKTEPLPDGSWRLQGDTPLYWLEEQVGQKIESDSHSNTVGGYVIECIDRLPIEGEVVELKEGNFSIEKVENHRLAVLKFYPHKQDELDE